MSMSEELTERTNSPGQEAAKEVFELINKHISAFQKDNQPDSAWMMQYNIYCILKERFERR